MLETTFAIFNSNQALGVLSVADITTAIGNFHNYISSNGITISRTEYKILHAAPAVRGIPSGANNYAPNPLSQHCLTYFQSRFSNFNLQPQMRNFLKGNNNIKFKEGLANLKIVQTPSNKAAFAKIFQVAFHVRGATHKKLLSKIWVKVTATPSMTKQARLNFEGWYQAL